MSPFGSLPRKARIEALAFGDLLGQDGSRAHISESPEGHMRNEYPIQRGHSYNGYTRVRRTENGERSAWGLVPEVSSVLVQALHNLRPITSCMRLTKNSTAAISKGLRCNLNQRLTQISCINLIHQSDGVIGPADIHGSIS